ncbi:MAG: DUF3943 domain-containing protein [Vicinamibacterales bacterium]
MRLQPFPGRLAALALAVLVAVLAAPALAAAQDPAPASTGYTPPVFGSLSPALPDGGLASPVPDDGRRACPGCPRRRPLWAFGEVVGANLVYVGFNLAFKPADEKIYYKTYPKIWWNNISYGFEWDDNTFMINQWGHPYQGSTYFSAGRGNGLSFWESAPLAAIGSLMWEYLAVRHKPSLNDLVMTTMGGIALGEMFHRTAWLIRDTTETGRRRMTREIIAAVVDPVTGINRFIDGDSGKVVEKPAEFIPSDLSAAFDAGVLWRGQNLSFLNAHGEPFLQVNLEYGTLSQGRSKQPFDAFLVNMRFGGDGGAFSEVRVRGRLTGWQLGGAPSHASRPALHFMTVMGYDYDNNAAFQFGGQDIAAAITADWPLTPAWRLAMSASSGFLVLGAIDSIYQSGPDRQYDFGPGLSYSAGAALTRRGHPFLRAHYDAVWLHTVDGAQSEHWTQSVRLDVIAPLRGRLGLGTSAEFVRRKSYYDVADDVMQRYPQLRVYLSWMR